MTLVSGIACALLLLMMTSSVTQGSGLLPNVCYNDLTEVLLVCPESDVCTIDDLGNGVCFLKGDDLPSAHCQLTEGEVLTFGVFEECDPFEADSCPEDQVCCSEPSGHRCVEITEWKRLRDDVHLSK